MKHFLGVAVFFVTLLFADVDAKASAPNEDNFTMETVWVDVWMGEIEKVAAFVKPKVSECDQAAEMQIALFIKKTRKTLEKELSQDDLLYLQNNVFFAESIIGKKRQCFVYQSDGLSVLKADIKNRLK